MVLPTCQAWLQVVARKERALGAPSGEELGVRSCAVKHKCITIRKSYVVLPFFKINIFKKLAKFN